MLTILLILAPAFLWYGFYKPLFEGSTGLGWMPASTLPALQNENVNLQNALDQISSVEKGAKKLNDEYLLITPEVKEKLMIMLPNTIDRVKLINEVKAIAEKSKVFVNGTAMEDTRPVGRNVGAYTVTLTFKARYDVIKKLMENYEKNMRFFVVESVSLKRPENGEGQTGNGVFDSEALNAGITFKVYYFKP